MGAKSVEPLGTFGSALHKFYPSPLRYYPLAKLMLDLLSTRLALFMYSIEKGEGEWFTSCTRFEVKK